MKSVNSTIRLNFSQINKLNNAIATSLAKTGEALKTEVIIAQVMPFDTSTMQNASTFVDDSNSKQGKVDLITSTPYARKVYYHPEYNFKKTENANAQGEWLESYVNGDKKDFCSETFVKFYREYGGLE